MSRLHPHETHNPVLSSSFLGSCLDPLDQLLSLLKCTVCGGQVKQAKVCSNCNRMICETCLAQWLGLQKNECPNCSHQLKYSSPINCATLLKQIKLALSDNATDSHVGPLCTPTAKVHKTGEFLLGWPATICPQHQLKLDYYCQSCQASICSDCAVLSVRHHTHRLGKLGAKKIQYREQVERLAGGLNKAKKQSAIVKEELMDMIDKVHRVQQNNHDVLKIYSKRLAEASVSKLIVNITSKTKLRDVLTTEISALNTNYHRIQTTIEEQDKCSLIRKSVILQSEIQNIIDKDLKPLFLPKSPIENQISPEFGSKTVVIPDFDLLRRKGQPLESEGLLWRGIQWKLKIQFVGKTDKQQKEDKEKLQKQDNCKQYQQFPMDNDSFLSVYLQMVNGPHRPNMYKYQILLINQIDFTKTIGCCFQNEFEEGAYWGLNHFIPLPSLYSQNFLHPVHGYLEFLFHVKPPSYYHAIRDQEYIIAEKERIKCDMNDRIKKMRNQAKLKVARMSKNGKRSWAIRALIDKEEPKAAAKRSLSYGNNRSRRDGDGL